MINKDLPRDSMAYEVEFDNAICDIYWKRLNQFVDEIVSVDDRILEAQEELKRLKAQLKQDAIERLRGLLECFPESYWDSILGEVYLKSLELPVSELGQLVNMTPHELREYVEYCMLYTGKCSKCGIEDYTYFHHKRLTLAEKKQGYVSITCDDCDKKEKAWLEQQKAIRRQTDKERLEEIERLRTMPYKEYLQSQHWIVTRKRAMKRANFKCQLCNSNRQIQVHHRTYENRGNEQNEDLIVLCRACHQKFHDIVEE